MAKQPVNTTPVVPWLQVGQSINRNNQPITAQSIWKDIFSWNTSAANITQPVVNNPTWWQTQSFTATNPNNTPVDNAPQKATYVSDTPKTTPTTTWTTININKPTPTPTKPVVTPKPTETTKPVVPTTIDPTVDPKWAIDQWKKNWSNINDLSHLVESKYGTTAHMDNWALVADINGKTYKWTIWQEGNAIKTLVWDTATMQTNTDFNNPNSLFNAFKTGTDIPTSIQNSQNYKDTKLRFDNYTKYANYSDSMLWVAVWNWTLIPWSKVYQDLQNDPMQSIRLQKAESFNTLLWKNKVTTDVIHNQWNKEIVNTSIKVGDTNMTLGSALKDWYLNSNEVNKLTYNEATTKQWKKAMDLKTSYQTLKASYDQIWFDVRKELKWSWATTSLMNKMIANRRRELFPELQQASYEANNAMWYYNQLRQIDTQNFATSLSSYNNFKNRELAQQRINVQQNQFTQQQYYNMAKLRQGSDFKAADLGIKKAQLDINAQNANSSTLRANKPVLLWTDKYSMPIMWVPNADWKTFTPVDLWWNINNWTNPSITQTIAKNEWWLHTTAYPDVWWVMTIWYGATSINWVPVKAWDTITPEQALLTLNQDISRHSNWKGLVNNPSQWVQSALSNFEFNLWPNIWKQPAAMKIIDKINSWDLKWAWDIMMKFNTVKWKVVPWLTNRRQWEVNNLLKPDTVDPDVSKIWKAVIEWTSDLKTALASLWNRAGKMKTQVLDYIRKQNLKKPNSNILKTIQTIQQLDLVRKSAWYSSLWGIHPTAVGWYTLLGTEARQAQKDLDSLNWKDFLEAIKWMKWMGSLSDAEWQKVAIAVANLWADWTHAGLDKNMTKLRQQLMDSIAGTQKLYWLQFDSKWNIVQDTSKSFLWWWNTTKWATNIQKWVTKYF